MLLYSYFLWVLWPPVSTFCVTVLSLKLKWWWKSTWTELFPGEIPQLQIRGVVRHSWSPEKILSSRRSPYCRCWGTNTVQGLLNLRGYRDPPKNPFSCLSDPSSAAVFPVSLAHHCRGIFTAGSVSLLGSGVQCHCYLAPLRSLLFLLGSKYRGFGSRLWSPECIILKRIMGQSLTMRISCSYQQSTWMQ